MVSTQMTSFFNFFNSICLVGEKISILCGCLAQLNFSGPWEILDIYGSTSYCYVLKQPLPNKYSIHFSNPVGGFHTLTQPYPNP
jgi:hypothetical protein